MKKGSVVLFKHKSGLKAGLADDLEGKATWKLVDERGQVYKVAERDVVWDLPGLGTGIHELGTFLAKAGELAAGVDIPMVWELLEGQKTTSLEALADLAFSGAEPVMLWAARQAAEADRIHFKEKGDVWEVRSPEQVRELGAAAAAEAARAQSWADFGTRWEALCAARAANAPSALPSDHRPCAWHPDDHGRRDALVSFALQGEDSPRKKEALKVLESIGANGTPEAAFRALVDCGHWHPHVHLGLLRRDIGSPFAPEVLAAAEALTAALPPDPEADLRQDLSAQRVYTVDSSSTLEIDDGLSWERDAEGREWIWIHIADPTRFIEADSLLDQEARRRSTTCYVATGAMPMLPFAISAGPASLNPGQTTPALSFAACLADDGSLADWRIVPSLVTPALRLTYEAADALLEDPAGPEAPLSALGALARKRLAWRSSRGAVLFRGVEVDVRLDQEGGIQLEEILDSPSRQLVSELMILSGEIAARFGQAHGLALPYRSQPVPTFDPEALERVPEGPARDFARRRSMPKSRTQTSPSPHSSLGLEAYVQVSSPLRRYNDLVCHRAIKAILHGQAAPSAEDWDQILAVSLPAMGDAAAAERESDRYWLLELMRRRGNHVREALVLGVMGGEEPQAVILFPDLGLEWNWKPGRSVSPGEVVRLRIKSADARMDRLVLQEERG